MEALALSHSFVAYESPESELQLKSLDELGLKIPNSAWIGVAGLAVALSVLSVPGEAQASGYRHYGRHHERSGEHYGERHRNRDRNSGYAEVATNGGRLNIRHRPTECSHVIGKLYNGDNVALTGRYRNGWAQLEGGGWVSASWLS